MHHSSQASHAIIQICHSCSETQRLAGSPATKLAQPPECSLPVQAGSQRRPSPPHSCTCLEILHPSHQQPPGALLAAHAAALRACCRRPCLPGMQAQSLRLSSRRQRSGAAACCCHGPEDVERAWGVGIQEDHLGWGGVGWIDGEAWREDSPCRLLVARHITRCMQNLMFRCWSRLSHVRLYTTGAAAGCMPAALGRTHLSRLLLPAQHAKRDERVEQVCK